MEQKTPFLKKFWRIVNIILTVILLGVLLANIYVLVAREVLGVVQPTIMGYANSVVVTGSMEPTIKPNDMIITQKKSQYQVNDVVTFYKEGMLVTHRIVSQTDEGFITKGDANNSPDTAVVQPDDITGAVIKVLPNIGQMILFFSSPLGILLLLIVGFAMIEIPRHIHK